MKLDFKKTSEMNFSSGLFSVMGALLMLNACSTAPKSHEFEVPEFSFKTPDYSKEEMDLVDRSIAQAQLSTGVRLYTELKGAPADVQASAMKTLRLAHVKTGKGEAVTMDNLSDLNREEGNSAVEALARSKMAPVFFKTSAMKDIFSDEQAYKKNRENMSVVPGKGDMADASIPQAPVDKVRALIRTNLTIDPSPQSVENVRTISLAVGHIERNTSILFLDQYCTRAKLSAKATDNLAKIANDEAAASEKYKACPAKAMAKVFIYDMKKIVQVPGNAHQVAEVSEELALNCGIPARGIASEITKFKDSNETQFKELPSDCNGM